MSATAADMRAALKKWPLVVQASNRSESFLTDARLVNCIAEQDPNTGEWNVQKRIGMGLPTTLTGGLAGLISCRGMYSIITQQPYPSPNLYTIVGNGTNASLLLNGATTGTVGGLTDTSSPWSFTETQPASGTRYLIFASLTNLYYSPGTGWTLATLQAGRGSFIVGTAYLDGTIYYMDEKCQIWGSALDDPTATWSTLNLIIAKKVPGAGVGLVKQLQYIIALKSASMEVFADAANATGSPLSQVDAATNSYGCCDRNTIQIMDDILFYMSSNGGTTGTTASPKIIRVDNLVPTVVSNPAIEKLIDTWQSAGNTYSWVFKHLGHRLYGISNATVLGTGLTLVYDIDEKLWYQWSDANGNWWPVFGMAIDSSYRHVLTAVNGSGGVSQVVFDQAETYPTDNGSLVPVDIYTPNVDFETRRRKTLHRMYIRADQTPGSILYIRRSNNDYKTWSNFRKLDLSKSTPYIDDEGTFTKRAYHFRHFAPTAFRIRSADLQMEIGTI